MQLFSAQDVSNALDYKSLVGALRSAFRSRYVTPVRHHHTLTLPDQADATMLIMPSWHDAKAKGTSHGGYLGVKMVTVYPDNGDRFQKPSIMGSYLLMDGATGEVRAIMDGPTITVWRTACASALASDFLSKPDSSKLLMIGTGALAPHLIRAHCAIRPIEKVEVWGRSSEKAAALIEALSDLKVEFSISTDRAKSVSKADIISSATLSTTPLIEGAWVSEGTHIDLVGGFRPDMREADDDVIRRSRVYVDTLAGATKEGGDITQPMARGVLALDEIRGDLYGLCQNKCSARWGPDEITFFKSVGTAIEDLATAQYIYEKTARA